MATFTAEVFQNEFLAPDASVVDAVVTVTTTGGPVAATTTNAVELLIVDMSGSMNEEGGRKIRAALTATAAAIGCIRDGVSFAVIGGRDQARLVYPRRGLAVADATTRAEAQAAVAQVEAEGGTAIGTWLDLARALVEYAPGAIAHAILLTDGKNQHQQPWELDKAIAAASGRFQCDCRGLGADWNVAELRKIASALLGTVDIIPDPSEMAAEFTALMEHAMGKEVGGVALRLWTPQGSTIEFLRQVSPNLDDLTASGVEVNPLTKDYALGAWAGDESRDYHLRVRVPMAKVGDERLAARVMLVVDDAQTAAGLVRAVWTDDDAKSTRINRQVAHYTGQAELAEVIADGLAARESGDEKTATVKLGRAVQLAHEAGNDGTVKLLAKVVEVDNAETGTVRLKREVQAVDAMALDVRSTRTVRVSPAGPPPATPSGATPSAATPPTDPPAGS
jgi:hypothetical protein